MSPAGTYAGVRLTEEGEGPAVVLLHGIGADARQWRLQIPRLARDHHVLAWDMPGYGGSASLSGTPAMADYADALDRALDDRGVDRAIVVGHSMGGMIALEEIARHPSRVRGLLLYATSAAFGPADGEWQRRFVEDKLGPLDAGRSMRDVASEAIAAMMSGTRHGPGFELGAEAMADAPEDAYRASVQAITRFDRRDVLARIDVPTLVLAAERDGNAPANMMERLAGRIPGARYACLPGAGHLAHLERPEDFLAELLPFLRNAEGGR
ncbi:MAG: alpha/beta fold hydrolase [Nocardioidaceae bacterium]